MMKSLCLCVIEIEVDHQIFSSKLSASSDCQPEQIKVRGTDGVESR